MFHTPGKPIVAGLLLFLCTSLSSQITDPPPRAAPPFYQYRNSIQVHGGLIGELRSYGFHLERMLTRGTPFLGKFSVGRSDMADSFSWYLQGQLGFLSGRGNLHLGAYIGYVYFVHEDYVDVRFFPNTASIELRYQKFDGRVLVRLGIGWPEGGFLGVGYCLGR